MFPISNKIVFSIYLMSPLKKRIFSINKSIRKDPKLIGNMHFLPDLSEQFETLSSKTGVCIDLRLSYKFGLPFEIEVKEKTPSPTMRPIVTAPVHFWYIFGLELQKWYMIFRWL